jgi:hypothetical protein
MNKNTKNRIIILLIVVGLIFIIVSTVNYAYRIPELDKQINEKNDDLAYTLSKSNEAKFGHINSNIHANTLYVLSTLMNITDVNLVFTNETLYFNGTSFTPGNYVKFKKNGKYEIQGSETEETERLVKNLLEYKSDIADMLRSYCAAQENCSFEDMKKIDEVTDLNTVKEMIMPYANESVNNMNRISTEINNLEKQKKDILFWSLFFQIFGIVLSQIAIILQMKWKAT